MSRPYGTLLAGLLLAVCGSAGCLLPDLPAADARKEMIDATTLRGRVMCGYQGWFRCPGDAANQGWVHWSRDSHRLTPRTLTFEMWPDMSDYPEGERFAAPGFSHPDGKQAHLFSSDNTATVRRHFDWLRTYGIDGVWLQHFVVDLPGGPSQERYESRRRVLRHVRDAANRTGRVWALSYDIAGMPAGRIFDVLTADWKRLVEAKVPDDPRYLHEAGVPVVQVWGFFSHDESNPMTPELANRLIDFFRAPGKYRAFLVGGGDWDWRRNDDPRWRAFYRRFDAYAPWNVGNYSKDKRGAVHAATDSWDDDVRTCRRQGTLWLPVVYPGFSWDNLKRKPAGTTNIPRRGGRFLWEQFHELARRKVDTVYVAMFDEVDEGTAIFKVTSSPPTQGSFVGYEGLPSDWYLRLVGEGTRMLRGQRPLTRDIPLRP